MMLSCTQRLTNCAIRSAIKLRCLAPFANRPPGGLPQGDVAEDDDDEDDDDVIAGEDESEPLPPLPLFSAAPLFDLRKYM